MDRVKKEFLKKLKTLLDEYDAFIEPSSDASRIWLTVDGDVIRDIILIDPEDMHIQK